MADQETGRIMRHALNEVSFIQPVSMLFRVATIDWVTFAVMSAVMVGVALLASYIPAWRASSVDPVESLRADA